MFNKGGGNVVSFALLCTLLFTMLLKILIIMQSCKARVNSQSSVGTALFNCGFLFWSFAVWFGVS